MWVNGSYMITCILENKAWLCVLSTKSNFSAMFHSVLKIQKHVLNFYSIGGEGHGKPGWRTVPWGEHVLAGFVSGKVEEGERK